MSAGPSAFTFDLAMRETIRNARRAGMSLPDIRHTLASEEVEVSIAQLRSVVRDVAAPFVRTGRRGASPLLKAEILRLVSSGRSYREAMVETGASSKLVWRVCRHLRLPRGRRPGGVRRSLPTTGSPCQEFRS